ncbi:hypothetical protein AVEN_248085-1, partial [Araneus ventricosus]
FRAHIGYSGNEAADVLATKVALERIPTYIPATRYQIKSLLQKESIISWQTEWDNGEKDRSVYNVLPEVKTTPTPWQRPEIMFVSGLGNFRHILNDSTSGTAIPAGAEVWETPYTMLQTAFLQPHTTKQNRQLTQNHFGGKES